MQRTESVQGRDRYMDPDNLCAKQTETRDSRTRPSADGNLASFWPMYQSDKFSPRVIKERGSVYLIYHRGNRFWIHCDFLALTGPKMMLTFGYNWLVFLGSTTVLSLRITESLESTGLDWDMRGSSSPTLCSVWIGMILPYPIQVLVSLFLKLCNQPSHTITQYMPSKNPPRAPEPPTGKGGRQGLSVSHHCKGC